MRWALMGNEERPCAESILDPLYEAVGRRAPHLSVFRVRVLVDLGLAAALASSFRDLPIDPSTVVIGEVGLAGEVRAVSHLEQRLKEAEKMGFQRAIVPQSALKGEGLQTGLKVFGAAVLQDALNSAMGR
jgi:predicted ATP-dependent serine protease